MRVVVTGMATWCALGRTLEEFEGALREGACGRRPIARLDLADAFYRTKEAATLAREEDLESEPDETKVTALATIVARRALEDAGRPDRLADPARVGIALGTTHGSGLAIRKRIKGRLGMSGGDLAPHLAFALSPTLLGEMANRLGFSGPTVVVSSACAAGTTSIGRGMDLVRSGRADVMLAGGADMFTELPFSGFNILGALARGPCRPLDRDRDGMMLGDGAAFVVLEPLTAATARGARVYVEVAGHAIASDAYHPTAPVPDGSAAARVMLAALTAAGLRPDAVDYINVHGTGTQTNDISELKAIERVFGARAKDIPLSSTKSLIGHALGAAGSLEFVTTALGMAKGFFPPGINLRTPIEGFENWAYVRDRARPGTMRAAISNSFGFSGSLSSIVVRRHDG